MACALCLSTLWSRSALAEPVRLLVAVGSKTGLQAEQPLKFAHTDATRVRDVVVGQGGVKPKDAFVLSEPSRAELFATIDRARAEAQKHKADEVTLFFYFSGHGDREAIHLGADRVLLSELTTKLREVPAALRIAVTDACRSTRDKGFAQDEPFAISATTSSQAKGQVWLHASSDGEAAQESDELQGAIFTNAWLNGLRGAADVNGDARVTLEESFAFAHSQTLLRSAKSSGVLQKPEAVMDLRETAPFVLTEAPTRIAKLSLPPGKDNFFLVYSPSAKSVISELWGAPDRRMLLNVPAGRYVVQRRAGARSGIATIAVSEGESRALEDREFAASNAGAVASKGSPFEPDAVDPPAEKVANNEVWAGYDVGISARTGLAQGAHVTYARAFRHAAIGLGAGAESGSRSLRDDNETLTTGYLRATIEARTSVGSVLLRAGAGGRAGIVVQTLTPTPDALSDDGPQSNRAFAFGPEIFAAARVFEASKTLFLDVGAAANMMFLRQGASLRGILGAGGSANVGARF